MCSLVPKNNNVHTVDVDFSITYMKAAIQFSSDKTTIQVLATYILIMIHTYLFTHTCFLKIKQLYLQIS